MLGGCNRTVGPPHVPQTVAPHSTQCSIPCIVMVDCVSSERWLWCSRCQRRIGSAQFEVTPRVSPASAAVPETPREWATQEPLRQMARLYGRRDSPITVPVSGTQSRLHCPVMSIALAGAGRAGAVPLDLASQFLHFRKDTGFRIINSLTTHFQSPSRQSSVALELQSPDAWSGSNHLSARLQESCVPPEVVEALNVWLTGHCDSHASGRTSAHAAHPVVPSHPLIGAPGRGHQFHQSSFQEVRFASPGSWTSRLTRVVLFEPDGQSGQVGAHRARNNSS